jgi:ATP-dependent Clp protease ATP-binding subunit ClpA
MTRLLLGVLDKATLRLGDNSSVNFERSMIFLTSNLGADAMRKELYPDFGFEGLVASVQRDVSTKLENIGLGAVRRKFSPEFVNRIDAVITYLPLESPSLRVILDQLLEALQDHIDRRLDDRAFDLELTAEAREFLLAKGTSKEYGARELKRTILRHLTQPLAALVDRGGVEPESTVRVELASQGDTLRLIPAEE